MRWPGVLLPPPGWDVSPSQGHLNSPAFDYSPIGGGGGGETHLYTWVERCTVRVKCLQMFNLFRDLFDVVFREEDAKLRDVVGTYLFFQC